MRNNTMIAVFCLIAFFFGTIGNSQVSVNHVKGLKTLGIKWGGTKYSPFLWISPEFNYYFNEKANFRANIVFDKGLIGQTAYTDLTVFAGGVFSPFNANDRVYLNIIAGPRAGIEFTSNDVFESKRSTTIYGASAGLELEYFISRIGLSFEFLEHYTGGSSLGFWHWNMALGFKYAL